MIIHHLLSPQKDDSSVLSFLGDTYNYMYRNTIMVSSPITYVELRCVRFILRLETGVDVQYLPFLPYQLHFKWLIPNSQEEVSSGVFVNDTCKESSYTYSTLLEITNYVDFNPSKDWDANHHKQCIINYNIQRNVPLWRSDQTVFALPYQIDFTNTNGDYKNHFTPPIEIEFYVE